MSTGDGRTTELRIRISQAAKSPALMLPAIAAPFRPVSVANASSLRLEKAAKSPPLRLRNELDPGFRTIG